MFDLTHFQPFFDAVPVAMVLSRSADGLILDVNAQCLHLTGLTREKVVGQRAEDLGFMESAHQRVRA